MVESVSRTGRELLNRPGTAEWKGAAKIREACGQVLAFFMILVDTSQTLKVKSKSVSDMDFPFFMILVDTSQTCRSRYGLEKPSASDR